MGVAVAVKILRSSRGVVQHACQEASRTVKPDACRQACLFMSILEHGQRAVPLTGTQGCYSTLQDVE